MAKRFTDIGKWHDEWFLELSKENKLVWLYLLDNCTNAGRWKSSFKHLNFCCDSSISKEEFEIIFKGRVINCGDFYFIPKFLVFQYPNGFMDSKKKALEAVLKELQVYDLIRLISDESVIDDLSIQETEKEKEKEKEKETDKDKDIKYKYGEFNHVLLKNSEIEKLLARFGSEYLAQIKKLDEGIELKGYTYKSHYLAILKWAEKDNESKPQAFTKPTVRLIPALYICGSCDFSGEMWIEPQKRIQDYSCPNCKARKLLPQREK
jgi:rubrerythrin